MSASGGNRTSASRIGHHPDREKASRRITRHTLVKGWTSPDDPTLSSYWATRRRRGTPPLDPPRLRLLKRQRGRCPLCGHLLPHADREPHHPDEWEQWITAVRAVTRHQAITLDARPGTSGGTAVFSLIHTHCRNRQPGGIGSGPALPQPWTAATKIGYVDLVQPLTNLLDNLPDEDDEET